MYVRRLFSVWCRIQRLGWWTSTADDWSQMGLKFTSEWHRIAPSCRTSHVQLPRFIPDQEVRGEIGHFSHSLWILEIPCWTVFHVVRRVSFLRASQGNRSLSYRPLMDSSVLLFFFTRVTLGVVRSMRATNTV